MLRRSIESSFSYVLQKAIITLIFFFNCGFSVEYNIDFSIKILFC